MGEASRRGTYEQRKAAAIERERKIVERLEGDRAEIQARRDEIRTRNQKRVEAMLKQRMKK